MCNRITLEAEKVERVVWIDLDERVAGLQRTHVRRSRAAQAVIAGGSWRIPEVKIFAKRAYGALQVVIHRHFVRC
jgi:hypothetical protein